MGVIGRLSQAKDLIDAAAQEDDLPFTAQTYKSLLLSVETFVSNKDKCGIAPQTTGMGKAPEIFLYDARLSLGWVQLKMRNS